jgi:hypothetical protein
VDLCKVEFWGLKTQGRDPFPIGWAKESAR